GEDTENLPVQPIRNEAENEFLGARGNVGFPGAASSTDENVAVLPPQKEQPLRRSKRIRQQRLEAIDDSDVQLNTEDADTSRQTVIDPQLEPSAPRRRGWKRAVGGHVGFPGAAGSTDANVALLPPQEEQPLRRSKRIRQQRLEAIDESDVQLNTEDAATSRQRVIDQELEPPAPRSRGWKRVEVAPAQPAQKPVKKRGKKPSVATLYCGICNKHFENKRAQQQHNYRRHRRRPSVCEVCAKSYADKSSLKEHIESAHESVGEEQCTFNCGAKFPTMKKRLRHETRQHIIKNCVCGTACKGSLSFTDHTKQCAKVQAQAQAQAQAPAELRCVPCKKEFTEKYELTVHNRFYHNKVYCDICDEYFDGKLEKGKHDRKHHKQ
ncbi:zinc finger protein 182-like isoform X1, partial [Leptotrombidium deliense]